MDVEISGHSSRVASPKCREEATSQVVWVQSASPNCFIPVGCVPQGGRRCVFFIYIASPAQRTMDCSTMVLNKYLLSDYVSGHYIKISPLRWILYYFMILIGHLKSLEISFSIFKIKKILATMRFVVGLKCVLNARYMNNQQRTILLFLLPIILFTLFHYQESSKI